MNRRSFVPVVAASLFFLGSLPAAELVRVRVLDPHDAAVPGARVEIRQLGGNRRLAFSGTTDISGVVEAPLAPPLEIRVDSADFDPLRYRLEAPSPGEITLRVRPAALRTTVDVVVRQDPVPGDTVGSAMEIESTGARTVFDAVELLVPGAFVTRRGVMGYGIATNGAGVVSIRGIGEQPNTGVLVIVDGRPDFQGLMGHPLPDFYSLSDAGSVSVREGPASVLYGSNAMGGVIEVERLHPREGMSTRVSSSLGSYLTGQHRLAHGARFEKSFYSLAAGVSHTQGDRPGSAFRNQDASLALGYDLSPVWKASLEGRYGHFHVEDPGPLGAPLSNSYARVGRGGFTLSLDNAWNRTWGYARLYSSYGHHIITDGFRSVDSTTGVRLHQHASLSPRLTVEAGSDIVAYGGRARNVLSRLDYGRHDLTTTAGFTRVQWAPARRLQLNSGVRYDHNSLHGDIVAPEFGAAITLADGYSIAMEAGRGFRRPTLRELYLFPAPNPTLKPERLWNYQATLQARPADTLAASATVYYADLSNLIVTTGRFPNLNLQNTGHALNRGWEGSVRWRPQKRVALQSGYAYLRSTNLAPYVPAHKWNYAVELDAGRVFVHVGGMTVGRRWADAGRTRELPGYTLATLRFTVPVKRHWNLFGMLDNLLDRRYEVVNGYPMPGVNATGGFSFSF